MEQDEIMQVIRSATSDVFTTMLSMEVREGQPFTGQCTPVADGVSSFVGLAGSYAGTGCISCSAPLACRLASQFLSSDFPSVNEEVLDAFGELANMIIGTLKTHMEEKLGPMGLSIPTVVHGRNFTTRSLSKNVWTIVPFYCGDDRFDVQLCLAPAPEKGANKGGSFSAVLRVGE